MIVGFRGSDCRVLVSENHGTHQSLDSWNQQHGSPLSGMSASSGEENILWEHAAENLGPRCQHYPQPIHKIGLE